MLVAIDPQNNNVRPITRTSAGSKFQGQKRRLLWITPGTSFEPDVFYLASFYSKWAIRVEVCAARNP
jgi:hypothetical protein